MITADNITHRPPPGFHVREATLDDVEDITRLWFESFNRSHKFWETATPETEATKKWMNQAWIIGILAGPSVLRTHVVEDLSLNRKLVAFSRIHVPQPDGNQVIPLPDVPAEWDPEVTDALWGGIARSRAKVMGQRLHWMGEFLGVDQPYQAKGVGFTMVDWICQQSDATGLPVYFDATIDGLPLYKKKFGFQEVMPLQLPERPETYGTYKVVAMVRQPRPRDIKSML